MSRQLDQIAEERETKRRVALVKALEFELPGVLASKGIEMVGFAVKYDAFECLMTIKADIDGVRQVCFVGGGGVIDCILRSVTAAKHDRLRWRVDKYGASGG